MLLIPKTGSWHFKVGVVPSSMVLSNCGEKRRIFGASSSLREGGETLLPSATAGDPGSSCRHLPKPAGCSPLCSAYNPHLPQVTLTPLGNESPRARVAARAEEAQVLPVNTSDLCVALSTSSHAGVSQLFQQTYLLAGMLADQQSLENIQGWAQLCCELGKCLARGKEAV